MRAPPPPGAEGRLPRAARLTARRAIERVFKQGGKHVGPALVLWSVAGEPGVPVSRLALSVSRRVGPAVRRNRVKRVLREAWRRLRAQAPLPLDMVVIARPERAPATLGQALAALGPLLARAQERARRQPP